jgi:hypothetical protein
MHKYRVNAGLHPLNCKHKYEDSIFVWTCETYEQRQSGMFAVGAGNTDSGDKCHS